MDRAGEGMTGDRGGMQGGQGQGLEMRLHRAPGKFSLSFFNTLLYIYIYRQYTFETTGDMKGRGAWARTS